MTGILPGRFVPTSGILHKYPATEKCNLDDTNAETKIETLADVEALPAEPRLCQNCFNEQERAVVIERWPVLVDEAKREVHTPGEEEPRP